MSCQEGHLEAYPRRRNLHQPNAGHAARPAVLWCRITSERASGGLVANARAQVINQRGLPIPGLYAAGNNAVHTEYGVGYQAGFSLGSGVTFGYLAARHMAGLN